ncbi:MAG: hypothetical protein CMM93_04895 [Rickettsiales bacterium]|nr:hypothetical protein [Rickettsiales bacterium]
MWMQVLRAAGFQPLGRAFPGDWGQTIADANPDGFYESRFRSGIFHATNPLPETGAYIHPDASRNAVVKIFPFGVRKTHRAFLDRLVLTMRPCAAYIRSRSRLYSMEHESRPEAVRERVEPIAYMPAYLEWFFENITLLGDVRLRKLEHRIVTYDRALREPQAVGEIVRWLGGDSDAAIAEIRGERQTQVGEWGELSDVPPPAMRNIFDALYQAFDDGGSPDAALLRAIRRVHAELLPRFQNAARAQTDDQRRWRQEILQLSRALP